MKTKNKPTVILATPVEPPILNKESAHNVQLQRWAYDELTALRALLKNGGLQLIPADLRPFVDEKQGDRQDAWPRGLCAGIAFRFARESLLRGER